MRICLIHLALTLSLLSAVRSEAATNVVVQGANFQTAISSSSSGDTLVVQSGVYSGNLNFDRSLTILCSGSQIQFSGNTTVTNNATVNFSQTQFAGTLQAATNTTVVLSQSGCSNSVTLSGGSFQAYDSQFQSLAATGGKVTVKRCNISGAINLTNAPFEALRMTNAGSVYATAPTGSATRFVVVQSDLETISVAGYSVWLGYNQVLSPLSLSTCDATLIGNVFTPPNQNGTSSAISSTGGTLNAYNNLVEINTDNSVNRTWYGILLSGCVAQIVNNTIYVDHVDYTVNGLVTTRGIIAQNGGSLVIRANIIWDTYSAHTAGYINDACVDASVQQVTELSYCDLYNQEGPCWTSGSGVNCFNANPQFNGDFTLAAGSPCIHAGPTNAIYNNTDGTRNTLGYTGGPLWNPANYTNNYPMVFFLSTSNQTVLKGLQTTIPVNVAASAGH